MMEKDQIKRVKYPRTFHVPWSPGSTSDDKKMESLAHFEGNEIVQSEKLDGEATTIYPDGYIHARSTTFAPHPSRDRVCALAAQVGHQLDRNLRICGENVTAKHSVLYHELTHFFYVYSIWESRKEGDFILSWDETEELCHLLELPMVPVLYRGPYNEEIIKNNWTGKSVFGDDGEGYVIRLANEFERGCFDHSIAKYVRPNHVQTNKHWIHAPIVFNQGY